MSATVANADMAKAWDGEDGDDWATSADHYDRASRLVRRELHDRVPVRPDERVLDIGCGNGAATCELAERARDGDVVGIDLSSRMLANARARAAGQGLTNVAFEHGDAQVSPFEPASRTLAVSVFGAMFFDDPVAAFANIGRALVPGGRLAVFAWRPLADNPWIRVFRDAFAAGRQLPEPPTGLPGPFQLADPDQARPWLERAGFVNVRFEAVDAPSDFGADVDEAFAFAESLGLVRGLSQGLDDAARSAGFTHLRRALEAHLTADGVLLPAGEWLVTAERAA